MEEEWRPVIGYEGSYEVSNLGRVKSLKRKNVGTDRILPGQVTNQGYRTVSLRHYKGKAKQFKVHRLVATMFLPNKDSKRTINHKNGIKSDNAVTNLEWMTYKENLKHARDTGLSNCYGENSVNTKLTNRDVYCIREMLRTGILKQTEIANIFGVKAKVVSEINVGTTWGSVK